MKLTKTMRTEVLTKVLKEVFEPKFNDLQKRLVEYGVVKPGVETIAIFNDKNGKQQEMQAFVKWNV